MANRGETGRAKGGWRGLRIGEDRVPPMRRLLGQVFPRSLEVTIHLRRPFPLRFLRLHGRAVVLLFARFQVVRE